MPHPWRHSRPGWMWLWAAWSSGLATLPMAGGLKLDYHYGPFQPRPFYDSMILKAGAAFRKLQMEWFNFKCVKHN